MTIPDHTHRSLTDLLSLAGRAAVVTGGAKGIGAQIVRRLTEAGADVVVGDIDAAGAAELAAEVAAASGRRVIACGMDVADTATLAAAADLAVVELGRLDIWVNNAGIFPTTGPAIDVTRTKAVIPTAIAPMTEKTSCQVSDGMMCFTMPCVA